ncbi:glycosyltransferase family 2 protein [uncultured Rikenella sp.]|uniref:glycosyltransferase family 2 protein n=1 Tax=uncultured Rikenella sp. TaxID=368003 RepID=UPI0025D644D0|nr:glycosyltransferase family 2 protein [uncultured Rikenella sp.]
MRIGIVIVNYNTCALLRNCLQSLATYLSHGGEETIRVAVVDNGSTDGSAEMVRSEFPEVVCVEAGENLGFGHANNLGVKVLEERFGEAEYLFFLNSDTVLLNDAPAILAEFLDNRPEAGVAGGNLFRADGTAPNRSFASVHGLGWELPAFIKRRLWPNEPWFNHTSEPRQVGYIVGADLMVRRAALKNREAFDPDFFMYYEDIELCVRIRRSGFEVWSVPQARIIHLAGQSCTVPNTKFQRIQESKYIYYNKVHGTSHARWAYRLAQTGYRLHAAWGRLTGNHAKRERYAEWAEINAAAWKQGRQTRENRHTTKRDHE